MLISDIFFLAVPQVPATQIKQLVTKKKKNVTTTSKINEVSEAQQPFTFFAEDFYKLYYL